MATTKQQPPDPTVSRDSFIRQLQDGPLVHSLRKLLWQFDDGQIGLAEFRDDVRMIVEEDKLWSGQ
jgi:hypothetical protein